MNYQTNTYSPKISVVIAAYNSELYITKCLDSIFNQTFKDFEVIVVNDGSTDHTREICERYATAHPNMTVINQDNGGIAKARNEGLKVCKGKYIAFSDSDDYADSNWLQHFMDVIHSHKDCDMVVQGLIVDYNDHINVVNVKGIEYEGNDIIDVYMGLKQQSIEGFLFNKLYKRSIIRENHILFEFTLKEDLLFNLKYLFYSSLVITVPHENYHYVQHGVQSLIHKRYAADYMKRLITSLYEASINLCNKCNGNKYQNQIIEEYLLSYSVLLFGMYKKPNNINERSERIMYIKEYQQIRKLHKNIKIRTGGKAKQIFASLMMMPAKLIDSMLTIIKNSRNN